ncbi:TetR family transcriptional regulator [Arthrobacter sp. UCD-GKA]|uniref:TetR/AcrR family transcriptional regulator n=1 Tax=Arthrobacter sp. UCD-GKA TaxID=1913576 RepID=UPI0008DE4552|nr:TetR/AcrR family transcriptional regulator [Arthrobacter sp. UCD-GKA]OIH83336.1 TetR family transcriptional regulator [Arthrobacter sp. UCD-GKA]
MSPTARPRTRMTGVQRRLQLIDISRHLFSMRGVDGTTIEEIARAAGVSKPVVYEHFGSKEALYMEVVTNEYRELLHRITESLSGEEDSSRVLLEKAALAMLTYIEECTEGFRILVRDAPPSQPEGTYSTLLTKVTEQVEHILADEFTHRGFSAEDGSIYAQMLVGMVAMTAQWWLDARHPDKRTVAAHVVNLAWYGLTGLRKEPGLRDGQTEHLGEGTAQN